MPYDACYESSLLRGTEAPRPWNLAETIKDYAKSSDTLLDIGCGTAIKLLQLAGNARVVYGIEPNERMRAQAAENVRNAGVSNILLIGGCAERLPFTDNSVDVVSCMVAPHLTSEVYRVLKNGGYAILEKIGEMDKRNFKEEFDVDESGTRGQFAYLDTGALARIYEEDFTTLFSEVSVREGFWDTWYSLEGLLLLLEQTPTIRDFDKTADAAALQKIQRNHTTPKGIATEQHRILIVARK